MTLFKGSILKKLIALVLLAVSPTLLILIFTEIENRQNAVAEAKKDAAIFLSNFTEIQRRVTDSTKSILQTVAAMPDIRNGNVEKARDILENLLEINSLYTNIILVNIDGNVIAAGRNHEKAIKLNFADRKQFQEAISLRAFSTGEFMVGKSTNKEIFSFGIPVFNEKNNPIGAIIIGVSLSHYGDLFQRGDYHAGSFFGICDHKGTRLFRYPSSEISTRGKPISTEVFSAAQTTQKAGSVVALSSNMKKKVIAFEPIYTENSQSPYMYMFLGTEYSEIQRKADLILKRVLLTSLLSLVLALLVARYLGNIFVANPMNKMTEVTRAFRKGKRNITTNIDYQDGEIGVLAKSFDDMIETILQHESEREKSLSRLSASEKRFREIIEDIGAISIQGYDSSRRVTFWNSASEELYGYTKEEAIGKKLEDLIIPENMHQDVILLHSKWIEGGQKIPNGELTLIDKNGNDIPVFSSHIMTDQNVKKEMFCVDIDLRLFKESEKAREHLTRQLQQAQKMEAIGTLAGGIAHDFNNILYPILGYTEMLIEDLQDSDELTKDSLQQIYSSTIRAQKLVQQILTFSRQEKPKLAPLYLKPVVKEVVKLIRSTFPKNVQIIEKIEKDCEQVLGDSTQVHQIIMNLTTNALHAIGDNNGKITVELLAASPEKLQDKQNKKPTSTHHVCLKISDTGTGIPETIVDKVFDPFFTTKKQGQGTGMGLSVVHGIIKNMNGSISVTSKPGKGTVFEMYFPTNINTEQDTEKNLSTQKKEEKIINKHILVVDDEKSVLDLTEHILKRADLRVTTVNNPLKALELFSSATQTFDLVLTDISMPEMTGIALAEKLHEIAPTCPIILCTGYNETINEKEANRLGVARILLKPIKKQKMLYVINEVLKEKEQ